LLAGCENDNGGLAVDGGVGRTLEILDPPGAQIGLRYGKSLDLPVRYRRTDAMMTPIGDAAVHFAIFDDPAGSTLSRDTSTTDAEGVAAVTLTAGGQEGSFRVRASADGADDVEFAIAISEQEFVELDAVLTDPLPSPGARTLTAGLYQDHACSTLMPDPKPTGADRTLVGGPAVTATLAFVNLLSRSYAVVGRVTDAGRLVAYGCLDVDRSQAPPGARLNLPIVLAAVQPSVIGGFDLNTEVGTSRAARTDSLFADIDVLDRCDGHLGQLLLDELSTRATTSRAAAIEALRGTPAPSTDGSSTVACRPAMVGAAPSLDADLGALVAAAGTPGDSRAMLLADLDAILQSAHLSTHLAIGSITPLLGDGTLANRYAVAHEGVSVQLSLGAAMRNEDLVALGLPVRGADGVLALESGDALLIDAHVLPIGLPALWGDAFGALSVAVRLPSLPDPTWSAWVAAAAMAAQRNAKVGCAAIEDLVCERTGPTGCAGTLIAPCTGAVAAVGARLDATFAGSVALSLHGVATVVDNDGDLVADRLDPGQWTASGAVTGQLSFSGTRGAP
jgi:hypothetical protein